MYVLPQSVSNIQWFVFRLKARFVSWLKAYAPRLQSPGCMVVAFVWFGQCQMALLRKLVKNDGMELLAETQTTVY